MIPLGWIAQAASGGMGSGLSSRPLAPAWLILPMAVVTLLVLAAHVQAMQAMGGGMPRSRRRIRLINAGLMLVTVPVLAYAFGIATPARAQAFALSWTASALLLSLIVLVAVVDVANTWRLHGEERQRIKAQTRGLRGALDRELEKRRGGEPSSDSPPRSDDASKS